MTSSKAEYSRFSSSTNSVGVMPGQFTREYHQAIPANNSAQMREQNAVKPFKSLETSETLPLDDEEDFEASFCEDNAHVREVLCYWRNVVLNLQQAQGIMIATPHEKRHKLESPLFLLCYFTSSYPRLFVNLLLGQRVARSAVTAAFTSSTT